MTNTSDSSAPDLDRPRSGESAVICRPAESAFQKGVAALRLSQTETARVFFESAIDLQRQSGSSEIQPRYLSYYGLTLMMNPTKRSTALELCRRAVQEEFFNPDLFLNLSRVCLRYGNRAEAYRAALSGLALDPNHSVLKRHLGAMGTRRPPLLRFLPRSNFLNAALGRILSKDRAPAPMRPGMGGN